MPMREWERLGESVREGLNVLLEEGEPDRSRALDDLMGRSLVKMYEESFLSDVDRFRKDVYIRGPDSVTHGCEITVHNVTAIVTKLLVHEQQLPPSLQGQIQAGARAINAFCFYPYIPAVYPSSPVEEATIIATSEPLVNRDVPLYGLTRTTFVVGVERVLNRMLEEGLLKEKSVDRDFRYVYMTKGLDPYLQ